MRKSFRGHHQKIDKSKEFRINEHIFANELMIIDENGENLGVMDKWRAIEEARSRDLDLIEVSPKANPPIAKFMDYGSYKYQKEKQERKQKSRQKTVETKTVKISPRIGQHDLEIRAKQSAGFLLDGDKIRIEMQLRGRENQHVDFAKENIKKLIEIITSQVHEDAPPDKEINLRVEQDITKLGNKLSTIISL